MIGTDSGLGEGKAFDGWAVLLNAGDDCSSLAEMSTLSICSMRQVHWLVLHEQHWIFCLELNSICIVLPSVILLPAWFAIYKLFGAY